MEDVYQHSVKQWWLSLTAGIIYLLLGAWVLLYTVESFLALTTWFIMGFGVLGLLNLYYSLNNRKELHNWNWSLMSGIMDLIITFLLITRSEILIHDLPIYIGFVLMFRSIIGIGFSVYLAQYKVRNWKLVLALSILGVILSLLLVWDPFIGNLTLLVCMGLALLSAGFAQIGMAYELKRYSESDHKAEIKLETE